MRRSILFSSAVILILFAPSARAETAAEACRDYRDIAALTADTPSRRTVISAFGAGVANLSWATSYLSTKWQAELLSNRIREMILSQTSIRDMIADSLRRVNTQVRMDTLANHGIETYLQHNLPAAESGVFFEDLKLSGKASADLKHFMGSITPSERNGIIERFVRRIGVRAGTPVQEVVNEVVVRLESAPGKAHANFIEFASRALSEEIAESVSNTMVRASPVLLEEGAVIATRLGEGLGAAAKNNSFRAEVMEVAVRGLSRVAPGVLETVKFLGRAAPVTDVFFVSKMIYDMHREDVIKERKILEADLIRKYFDVVDADAFCKDSSKVSSAEGAMIHEMAESIQYAKENDMRIAALTPESFALSGLMTKPRRLERPTPIEAPGAVKIVVVPAS